MSTTTTTTTTTANATTLEGVVVVTLSNRVYRGGKQYRRDRLPADVAAALPPLELGKDGCISILSRDDVQPLLNIIQNSANLLRQVGVPGFQGGYVIPEDVVRGKVLPALKAYGAEFTRLRDLLLAQYQERVAARADLFPAYREHILGSIDPLEEVSANTFFRVAASWVSAYDFDPDGNHLVQQIAGFAGEVDANIRSAAADLVEAWTGKERFKTVPRKSVGHIRDKMASFSYLNGSFNDVVERLDAVMASMPHNGPLEGAELSLLRHAMRCLSKGDPLPDLRGGHLPVLPAEAEEDAEVAAAFTPSVAPVANVEGEFVL